MKTILVLSDTHRNAAVLSTLESRMLESDYVFHLGDFTSDMSALKPKLFNKLVCVRGNGDVGSGAPDEKVVDVEGVRFFLTHGHRYNVKSTLVNVGYAATAEHADVALYGHTHFADITEFEGVKLINPGCLCFSGSGILSYAYIMVYGGKIYPKLVELT